MRVRSLFFLLNAVLLVGAGCANSAAKPGAAFPNVTPIITTSTQAGLPPIADPTANVGMLPAAPVASTASYATGQTVFANWKNGAVWYEGVITDISGKLYTVKFNAGDTESAITEARLFAKPPAPVSDTLKPKEIVIARLSNGSWYKGAVYQGTGEKITVKFDDKSSGTFARADVIPQLPHATAQTSTTTAAAGTTTAKTPQIFRDRTKVLVNWQDGPRWWDAILNTRDGDKYSVTYNDDHSTESVPTNAIANYPDAKAARTPHIGDKIIARAQNGYWYNATISTVNGTQIGITFFDGYTQTISPAEYAVAGQ